MLSVLGIGYSHPTIVIDNQFLEDLQVGTNAQWILEKIGIRTRFTSLPLEYISKTRNEDPTQALGVSTTNSTQLGINAGKMALERSGIKANEVGLVICNCCVPKELAPTESKRIAAGLGISAPTYEVFSACPAFALQIDFLNNFEEDVLPKYILCVSTATLTHKVNYNDRSDGAIWGDGAAAWVVSSQKQGKLTVVDSIFTADPTRCEAVVVDTFGHFHQDGRAVRDFSVRQTVRLIKSMEEKHNLDWSRDVFIGHQANATMLEQITNNREIPPINHWHNVETHGNQAGAGAPVTLGQHWDQIKSGQRILIAVVGAGLSWGSVLLEAR